MSEFQILFWLGIPMLLAGVVLAWWRPADAEGENPGLGTPWALAVLFGGLLVTTAALRDTAVFLISGDEYHRLAYAYAWAERPFLAQRDHIWPAGQFYVLGSVKGLVGDMRLAVALTSTAGMGVMALLLFFLARRTGGGSEAALVVALLGGTHWVNLWAYYNPLAEVFFFPALLGGYLGFQRWATAPEQETGWQRERWLLAAAASLALGTLFRYEAWYAGFLLGLLLLGRIVWLIRRDGFAARTWVPAFLGGMLLSIFPLVWMGSSAVTLGGPLRFLQDNAQMNRDTNLSYDLSSPLAAMMIYPRFLVTDHLKWMPLVAAGLLAALAPRCRRSTLPVLGAFAVILALAMLATSGAGLGSNNRPRYTLFLLLPLMALGAVPLQALWSSIPWRPVRWGARGLIVAWTGIFLCYSVTAAKNYYPAGFNVNPDFLALVQRIQLEPNVNKMGIAEFNRIHPRPQFLCVYAPTQGELVHVARYHSAQQKRVYGASTPEELKEVFWTSRHETRVVVMKPRPEFERPPRAVLLEDRPSLEVWILWGEPTFQAP